jgi:hypothetical protein
MRAHQSLSLYRVYLISRQSGAAGDDLQAVCIVLDGSSVDSRRVIADKEQVS